MFVSCGFNEIYWHIIKHEKIDKVNISKFSPIEQFISITVVEMSPYLSYVTKKKQVYIRDIKICIFALHVTCNVLLHVDDLRVSLVDEMTLCFDVWRVQRFSATSVLYL